MTGTAAGAGAARTDEALAAITTAALPDGPPPPSSVPHHLPSGAPTAHQEAALERIGSAHNLMATQLDGALTAALGRVGDAVAAQLAAVDERTAAAESAAAASAQARRAQVAEAAGGATGAVGAAAARADAAAAAAHQAALGAGDSALTTRQDAALQEGQRHAAEARSAAAAAASGVRAEAAARATAARATGRSAAPDSTDEAVRSAQAASATELVEDTVTQVDTAAGSTAGAMLTQGEEVAEGTTGLASELAAGLGSHRESLVGQLAQADTAAAAARSAAADDGARAVQQRHHATLAGVDRAEEQTARALEQQADRQRQEILRAGADAARHLRAAAAAAAREAARDLEEATAQLVSQRIGRAATDAVVGAAVDGLGAGLGQVSNALGTRAEDVAATLSSATGGALTAQDGIAGQAEARMADVADSGARGMQEVTAATAGGIAAVVEQARTAEDTAVTAFTGVLDQHVAGAQPAVTDLAARHDEHLAEQATELRERTAEAAGSLDSRIGTAQERARERAERSWLENQLADLWDMVTSPEFLVGLVVGLVVGIIIIASAGTATPFVIMAAGIAAGAAGAAAGTMVGNVRAGKTGWDVFDDVGRNALIGGLAGGIGAGVFLFGAGVVAGLGLTGTAAAVGTFIVIEAAAVISNTVINIINGDPWDKNLLAAMLLAPLLEVLGRAVGRRIPARKPSGPAPGDDGAGPVPGHDEGPVPRGPRRPGTEGPDQVPEPDDGEVPRRPRDGEEPDQTPEDQPDRIPEGTTDEDVHIEDLHADREGRQLDPAVCFPAGTLVATPDGPRPIETVAAGDLVLALDLATGAVVRRPVLAVVRGTTSRWTDVRLTGESIRATPAHRFWTVDDGAWTMAQDLPPGATVRLVDGGTATVVSVGDAPPEEPEATYNLSVADAENYFVGSSGVLVHNITAQRMAYLSRPGYRNYVLRDASGKIYYSGMCRPGETMAGLTRRHGRNHNRFSSANGDVLEFVPGTREYGEARLLEHQNAVDNGTIIGRDGTNYRGNRQAPLDATKMPEYLEYRQVKQGCG